MKYLLDYLKKMDKITKYSLGVFCISLLAAFIFWFTQINSLDRKGPEIKMEKDVITVGINATDKQLLKGVTAIDKRDGDVSDTLVVEKMSNFLSGGKREITYAAVDKSSNVSRATRIVQYKNYKSPRFDLKKPFVYGTASNEVDITENLIVKDRIDGDISKQIKLLTRETIDLYQPGDYQANFQVTNSAGERIVLPATISVYSNEQKQSRPFIYLDDYLIYIKKGSKISPSKHILKVGLGTGYEVDPEDVTSFIDPSEVVVDKSNVDYEKPGIYEMKFSVRYDGQVGSVNMIIVVEE